MDFTELRKLLTAVQNGETAIDAALERLRDLPFEDVGVATIDHHRALRQGVPEVVLGEAKTPGQLVTILERMAAHGSNILVTRLAADKAAILLERFPGGDYDTEARTFCLLQAPIASLGGGRVLIVCAGTSDLPVAREAAVTARMLGNEVDELVDVGVAGIHRLLALARAPFAGPAGATERRILWLLIAASVPTAVIGLAGKDFFESLFTNIPVVAVMLLVTGTLLFLAERHRRGDRREDALTLGDALLVGTVQGLAVIPGISRSGSTIATLLLRGVDGETAARFSFLLALPAVAGASLLSARHLGEVAPGQLPVYLAGAGVAFAVGLLAIHLVLAVVRHRRLALFAGYCWLAGGLAFLLTM